MLVDRVRSGNADRVAAPALDTSDGIGSPEVAREEVSALEVLGHARGEAFPFQR